MGFIPLSVGSALFTQGGGKCYLCHFLSLLLEMEISFGWYSSALQPRRVGEELSKYWSALCLSLCRGSLWSQLPTVFACHQGKLNVGEIYTRIVVIFPILLGFWNLFSRLEGKFSNSKRYHSIWNRSILTTQACILRRPVGAGVFDSDLLCILTNNRVLSTLLLLSI